MTFFVFNFLTSYRALSYGRGDLERITRKCIDVRIMLIMRHYVPTPEFTIFFKTLTVIQWVWASKCSISTITVFNFKGLRRCSSKILRKFPQIFSFFNFNRSSQRLKIIKENTKSDGEKFANFDFKCWFRWNQSIVNSRVTFSKYATTKLDISIFNL